MLCKGRSETAGSEIFLFEGKSILKNALQTVAVGSLYWLARAFCVKLAVAIPAKPGNGYNSRLGFASNRPWDFPGGFSASATYMPMTIGDQREPCARQESRRFALPA